MLMNDIFIKWGSLMGESGNFLSDFFFGGGMANLIVKIDIKNKIKIYDALNTESQV